MVQKLQEREEDLERLRPRLAQQRLERPDARRRVRDGGGGEQGVVEPGGEDRLREAGEPEAEGAGDLSFFCFFFSFFFLDLEGEGGTRKENKRVLSPEKNSLSTLIQRRLPLSCPA